MILQVFAARDNAVDAFMPPFFCRAKGEAIRSFMSACMEPEGSLFKNRVDYDLYHLAFYDDATGTFEQVSTGPERVLTGRELSPNLSVNADLSKVNPFK